jgi:hypothetical protein
LASALVLLIGVPRGRADEREDFTAIDRYARSAPAESQQSVAALAAYLRKGAKTDRELARAIYVWITDNLAYDFDNVATGKWEQRPEVVVRQKCTDCGGHSRLFEALARSAGLRCRYVVGHVKVLEASPTHGLKYARKTRDGVIYDSHAWNAVKIDGKWYLVDVTSGNGRESRQGKVEVKRPTTFAHFLVPPESMIYMHFPSDPSCQFLPRPYTRQEHALMPLVQPAFFRHHFQLGDMKTCLQSTTDELKLTLAGSREARLILVTTLRQGGKQLEDGHVLAQRIGDDWEVRAAFPQPGDYVLRLFARSRDAAGQIQTEWILDSRITAGRGKEGDGARLPVLYDRFHEEAGYLHGPLSGVLVAGRPQTFKAVLPTAVGAAVQVGGKFIALQKEGGAFVGDVPLVAGEVVLCAEFPSRKNFYWGLVKYAAK